MLWLALHLPQFALQALPWSQPGFEAALPVAVAKQHELLGVNRAGRALGARVGQSVATALSLAPQLTVLHRDPAREAGCLERLALAMAALTPNLCLASSGVLLEVQASLRLFGGIRRLLRRAATLAAQCGLHARLACAPTANAAWLLATSGIAQRRCLKVATCTRRLDCVPVSALQALLPLTPRQEELLQALGVQQLGELRALPRAGLQRRLGRGQSLVLDRAYAEAPDPRRWFEPPERFEIRRELLQRADDAAVLCAAVDALLPALQGWLQLHWHAASVVALRLKHEHRREPVPDTVLRLQLSTASRDIDAISLLWRERLQRHTLTAPVYEVELLLEASVPHAGIPGELLPLPGSDARRHAALLDRLVARLGPDRVQRFEPVADHRPERAQRGVSVVPHAASATQPAAPPPEAACFRPAWLLRFPVPLSSDAYGRPLQGGRPLQLCSHAERIESGWFDGALARRDYHVAVGNDHRLRWIYREWHACTTQGERSAWFLHGWFG